MSNSIQFLPIKKYKAFYCVVKDRLVMSVPSRDGRTFFRHPAGAKKKCLAQKKFFP